jgi:hypothetical protein
MGGHAEAAFRSGEVYTVYGPMGEIRGTVAVTGETFQLTTDVITTELLRRELVTEARDGHLQMTLTIGDKFLLIYSDRPAAYVETGTLRYRPALHYLEFLRGHAGGTAGLRYS